MKIKITYNTYVYCSYIIGTYIYRYLYATIYCIYYCTIRIKVTYYLNVLIKFTFTQYTLYLYMQLNRKTSYKINARIHFALIP